MARCTRQRPVPVRSAKGGPAVRDFDHVAFGFIQDTDGKQINILQFEVRMDLPDIVPPILSLPADVNVEGNAQNGYDGTLANAYDPSEVTAIDNVDPNPTVTCDKFPTDFYNYNSVIQKYFLGSQSSTFIESSTPHSVHNVSNANRGARNISKISSLITL